MLAKLKCWLRGHAWVQGRYMRYCLTCGKAEKK